MPAKNSIKEYVEGGIYHIYNRGVEKRDIFLQPQDYSVFINYLKEYLEPRDGEYLRTVLQDPKTTWKEKDKIIKQLNLNNFVDKIELLAFCLMPNHFHLLIKQLDDISMDFFMRSLGTRYTMYFNKKYERTGHLYQGRYKAVLVETNEQLIYLSKYIHKNPGEILPRGQSLRKYKYSSYPFYLHNKELSWFKPKLIFNYFDGKPINYKNFVEEIDIDSESISRLIIDE